MSEDKRYSVICLRFLSLSEATRKIPIFSAIEPVEERLLCVLASLWHQEKKITVLQAMSLQVNISSTTLHRRLMSLRSKGLIALQVSESDNRVKFVIPTDLTQKYFAALGRALVLAQRDTRLC